MSYKNFLHNGPNDVARYENDPLDSEFLTHFTNTSYITSTFKKRISIPPDYKNQYEIMWRGPICVTTSIEHIKALLQKHVDDYSEYVVEAFFILHDINGNKSTHYRYLNEIDKHRNFELFRDTLLYQLIVDEQLFVFDYNTGEYLSELDYYGRGYFDEGFGLGTIYFSACDFAILDKIHWHHDSVCKTLPER